MPNRVFPDWPEANEVLINLVDSYFDVNMSSDFVMDFFDSVEAQNFIAENIPNIYKDIFEDRLSRFTQFIKNCVLKPGLKPSYPHMDEWPLEKFLTFYTAVDIRVYEKIYNRKIQDILLEIVLNVELEEMEEIRKNAKQTIPHMA